MDREEIERLWLEKGNWTWGVIYHCREDPRAIVPRRSRWGGWTLNFRHPRAGLIGLAAFALALGPGLLALYWFNHYWTALVVMVLSIVAVVAWAHRESSRIR